MTIRAIEITFAQPVELTRHDQALLFQLASAICARYSAGHPARVAWPLGVGAKPLTRALADDETPTFDDGVFQIECFEREDYAWPCVRCAHPQGDHAHCIADPAAGACAFEPVAGWVPPRRRSAGPLPSPPRGRSARPSPWWLVFLLAPLLVAAVLKTLGLLP